MKTSRLPLLAASAALALSLAGGTIPLRADPPDEAKRREAAEQFLKVRKTADVVNNQANRMAEATDRLSDNLAKQAGPSVNQQEFSQKLRTEAHDLLHKEFGWEALKPEFVQAYSQAFTEAELKDLTAFYETPTGKKLAALEPEISSKLSRANQERTMGTMRHVMQRLQEMVAATKPAPTPGAVLPGAPGSAPGMPSLPPGLTAPPPPPPGLTIPPPPPPGAIPAAPPAAMPPAVPPAAATPAQPSSLSASTPGTTPGVHRDGKTEPDNR